MTDGHQLVSPVFFAGNRFELIAAFSVDPVDHLPHDFDILGVEVGSPLLQDL